MRLWLVGYVCKYLAKKEPIPFQQIWKVKTHLRIAFFTCETGRACIFTFGKLMRRRKTIVNYCFLCKRVEENCDYILLWCPLAYSLWSMAYEL